MDRCAQVVALSCRVFPKIKIIRGGFLFSQVLNFFASFEGRVLLVEAVGKMLRKVVAGKEPRVSSTERLLRMASISTPAGSTTYTRSLSMGPVGTTGRMGLVGTTGLHHRAFSAATWLPKKVGESGAGSSSASLAFKAHGKAPFSSVLRRV